MSYEYSLDSMPLVILHVVAVVAVGVVVDITTIAVEIVDTVLSGPLNVGQRPERMVDFAAGTAVHVHVVGLMRESFRRPGT